MTENVWFWVALMLTGLLICIELVDRFQTPIMWWRKIRWPVAAFIAGVWALLIFRKTDTPGTKPPEVVKPTEYDDTPERELDASADNTDLEAAATDRAAAADPDEPSIDELRSELDSL